MRPGVSLIGCPAASTYWVGVSSAGLFQLPRISCPPVKTHASPLPTVCASRIGTPKLSVTSLSA